MKHQLRPVAQSPRKLSYRADGGIPRSRCKPQHRFLVSLEVVNFDVRESGTSLAKKFSRSTAFPIYMSRLVVGLGVHFDGVPASCFRGLGLFGLRRAGRPLAAAINLGNRRPTSVKPVRINERRWETKAAADITRTKRDIRAAHSALEHRLKPLARRARLVCHGFPYENAKAFHQLATACLSFSAAWLRFGSAVIRAMQVVAAVLRITTVTLPSARLHASRSDRRGAPAMR